MSYRLIYVHIPFCLKRCNYCDFVSNPIVNGDTYYENYSKYVIKEIALYGGQKEPIKSLYFGGGTPTTLPVNKLTDILKKIAELYVFAPDIEITVEANPATVDFVYLQALKKAGVNRLSLGGQSFNDAELGKMGRIHKAVDITATVNIAREAGFSNIGVDLIYALPNQTEAEWYYSLEQTIALNTEHISLYSLQLDNNSPWGKLTAQGEINEVDEYMAADMLKMAIETLEKAGFTHYEIANFARLGFESRHNNAYWQRENYLGLGVAAASCLENHRWVNTYSLADYFQKLDEDVKPLGEEEYLSDAQVVGEAIFLGLRKAKGINVAAIKAQYGVNIEKRYAKELKELVANGLLKKLGKNYSLTEKGLFLGNQVFMRFV
ncbi:MAG: radical SAM family heme chaperone HemW [Clostridia bacterium]|nr:radical SAM family heme chaperone HemW [Clostridia bacterium]